MAKKYYLPEVLELFPPIEIVDWDNVPNVQNVVADAIDPRNVELVGHKNQQSYKKPRNPVGNQHGLIIKSTCQRIIHLKVKV